MWLTGDQWQKEGTFHHHQAITTFNLTLKLSSYQESKGNLIFGTVGLLTSSLMILDFVLTWQMCHTNNTLGSIDVETPVSAVDGKCLPCVRKLPNRISQLFLFGSNFSPVINLRFPSAAQINSKVDIGPQIIPEEQREEKENKQIHLTRTEQTNAFDRPISGLNSSFCIQWISELWEV